SLTVGLAAPSASGLCARSTPLFSCWVAACGYRGLTGRSRPRPAARGSARPLLVILSEHGVSSNETIAHFFQNSGARVQDDQSRWREVGSSAPEPGSPGFVA